VKDSAPKDDNELSAAELRARLVAYLVREGAIHSRPLERAFAEIPREIFLPADVPLSRVYSDEAIVVKWDEQNHPSSSSTQPFLMADMLEILHLEPGMRVLEIGAGVGYNAAIMAHCLGESGSVTSVDLDPAMAELSRRNLMGLSRQLGPNFERVQVIAADGSAGYPLNAPYDRIIVTVQQWEISPDWVEQLKTGGLLVLPITLSTHLWGGLIPAFCKEESGILRAVAASQGGFMPMRGELAHPLAQSQPPNERGSLVRLPFSPAEALPGYEPPPDLPAEAPEARLFLSGDDLPPEIQATLENPDLLQVVARETLPLELDMPAEPDANVARRQTAQAFYGFNMSLAVALQDRLFPLVLATPASGEKDGAQGTPGEPGNARIKDGWRYEVKGVVLIEALDGGYDLAMLTGAGLAANWRGWLAQGWRLAAAEASAPTAPLGNRTLQKVGEIWQAWQHMGRPTPAQYRPLAFPADQPPPEPGYVIPRRFFNLLLPFEPSRPEG
jgi:protein-L-isoaspartate(D-aspartate) O-methyltransferase